MIISVHACLVGWHACATQLPDIPRLLLRLQASSLRPDARVFAALRGCLSRLMELRDAFAELAPRTAARIAGHMHMQVSKTRHG